MYFIRVCLLLAVFVLFFLHCLLSPVSTLSCHNRFAETFVMDGSHACTPCACFPSRDGSPYSVRIISPAMATIWMLVGSVRCELSVIIRRSMTASFISIAISQLGLRLNLGATVAAGVQVRRGACKNQQTRLFSDVSKKSTMSVGSVSS